MYFASDGDSRKSVAVGIQSFISKSIPCLRFATQMKCCMDELSAKEIEEDDESFVVCPYQLWVDGYISGRFPGDFATTMRTLCDDLDAGRDPSIANVFWHPFGKKCYYAFQDDFRHYQNEAVVDMEGS